MLEEEDVREREGREMAILAMATDKAREQLYNYHQYQDNKVDIPVLNNDSIILKDIDEKL